MRYQVSVGTNKKTVPYVDDEYEIGSFGVDNLDDIAEEIGNLGYEGDDDVVYAYVWCKEIGFTELMAFQLDYFTKKWAKN